MEGASRMAKAEELILKLASALADDSPSRSQIQSDYRSFVSQFGEAGAIWLAVGKYVNHQIAMLKKAIQSRHK
jgi:hypothetical protein